MPSSSSRLSCLCLLALLANLSPLTATPTSSEASQINDGYSLLYKLSGDESQASMLFIVKDAPAEVSTFGDRISRTANDTLVTLEKLRDHDPALQFDCTPLPQIEKDVRASIKDDKQHQLLFGTTGTEFIRAFLVTQIEASTYAQNLSKVLAEKETNPHRIALLRHISAQWLAMRKEAFRILRDY